jgi:hypothetical protein
MNRQRWEDEQTNRRTGTDTEQTDRQVKDRHEEQTGRNQQADMQSAEQGETTNKDG